jgi:hypothetical protein
VFQPVQLLRLFPMFPQDGLIITCFSTGGFAGEMAIFFGIFGIGKFVPFFISIGRQRFVDVEGDLYAGPDAIANTFFDGLCRFSVGWKGKGGPQWLEVIKVVNILGAQFGCNGRRAGL